MSEAAPTVFTQYVFVDVLEFANRTRSVEAQADIIHALNAIVTSGVTSVGLSDSDVIYFPAGDGICIALPGLENDPRVTPSYDLHLRLGLALLEQLSRYNEKTEDDRRQFQIRVGINQNVDNVVQDINGMRSLAGAGINTAQRVMDQAGGMQLLVGENVYNTLRHREKYMDDAFRPYSTTSKHGDSLTVYQFRDDGLPFLSSDALPSFAKSRETMTRLEAYYIVHAEQQKDLIANNATSALDRDAAVVWLFMLTTDSIRAEREPRPFGGPTFRTRPKPPSSPEDQIKYYRAVDIWVVDELSNRLLADELRRIASLMANRCFATPQALTRLRDEWPDIAERLSDPPEPSEAQDNA